MIPRQIIRTYKDYESAQPFLEAWERTSRSCPSFRQRFFSDRDMERYIDEFATPEQREAFISINPLYGCARADFFRYLIIHREGGVYLDIKTALVNDLENLLQPDDELLLSHWSRPMCGLDKWPIECGEEGEFQNFHIVGKKNSPLLGIVLDHVTRNIKDDPGKEGGKHHVLVTTGPVAYTIALKRSLSNHNYRIVAPDLGGYVLYAAVPHQLIAGMSHYTHATEPLISLDKTSKIAKPFPWKFLIVATFVMFLFRRIHS